MTDKKFEIKSIIFRINQLARSEYLNHNNKIYIHIIFKINITKFIIFNLEPKLQLYKKKHATKLTFSKRLQLAIEFDKIYAASKRLSFFFFNYL